MSKSTQPPLIPGASQNCQSFKPAVGLAVFEAQAGGSCLGNSRVGWRHQVEVSSRKWARPKQAPTGILGTELAALERDPLGTRVRR